MTKVILKILFTLLGLYLAAWVFVGVAFTLSAQDPASVKAAISHNFAGRKVDYSELNVAWQNGGLQISMSDFSVAGDTPITPALAFKQLNADINPWSFLALWPRVSGLSIDSPVLEIDTTEQGVIRVAGVELGGAGLNSDNKRRVLQWLLDQQNTAVHNGSVVWRKSAENVQRYTDMHFVFEREQEARTIVGAARSVKGALALNLVTQGDIVEQSDWDAQLEVLGGGAEPLLGRDDLQVTVADGVGEVWLKALDVERINDFLALLDVGAQTQWFLDANLGGRLEDLRFMFKGPLLDLDSWNLEARAVDLALRPLFNDGRFPRLNGLDGSIVAAPDSGSLKFSANDAEFEWDRYFDYSLPITATEGVVEWDNLDDGRVVVSLDSASFEDQDLSIKALKANAIIGKPSNTIENFGDLFTVDSIRDLEFEQGAIVQPSAGNMLESLNIDVSAEFDVRDVGALDRYIPSIRQTELLKTWWVNAFKEGTATNGTFSLSGPLTTAAFRSGQTKIAARADFDDVVLDYGYQRQWPVLERAHGALILADGTLTIETEQAFLEDDEILSPQAEIVDLLKLERTLNLSGRVSTDFIKGTKLVLQGPLLAPEDRPEVLPVNPTQGRVDVELNLAMPLANVSELELQGSAQIVDAAFELEGGVPISDINTRIDFSEDTVVSDTMVVDFLGGKTTARLETVEPGAPPKLKVVASGTMSAQELVPWLGEHVTVRLDGQANWEGQVMFDTPQVLVQGRSDLLGVSIDAPAPLGKPADAPIELNLDMRFGNSDMQQTIDVKLADIARIQMRQDALEPGKPRGSLYDAAQISVGHLGGPNQQPGVNIDVRVPDLNLDDWLETIVDISMYEPEVAVENTDFLDAMREIRVSASNPIWLAREFGNFELFAESNDGEFWFGNVDGERISGNLQMQPRADVSQFRFDLAKLHLGEEVDTDAPVEPIDQTLEVSSYPALVINVEHLKYMEMELGKLAFSGAPQDQLWVIDTLSLEDQGVKTVASGQWSNDGSSFTQINFETDIQAAGDALDSLDFAGFLRKGRGYAKGVLEWRGAPHEFDYSRLGGEFDIRIKDGELVQVSPGSGRLLGLLNFNALLRRVTFDFSDVIASGLRFDQMQYTGVLAEGEAIMNEAYMFSPAAFVRIEGKVDLDEELIDMDMHVAPEVGGNLTLISALANPTAGAVMFVLQNIFKDEMRSSSFVSYRAEGTWEDFEFVEITDDNADVILQPEAVDPEPLGSEQPAEELPLGEEQPQASESSLSLNTNG